MGKGNEGSKRRDGLTLIEITLAMLVISVGLLTVFGLFGASLRTNVATLDDTVAATFADKVFGGMRARFGDSAVFVGMDSPPVSSAGGQFWSADTPRKVILLTTGRIHEHLLRYDGIDYYNLRYEVAIEPQGNNYRGVTLWVWLGDGSTERDKARVFHTRLYRFK